MQSELILSICTLVALLLVNIALQVSADENNHDQSANFLSERLNPTKGNKISTLLHFLHSRSKESVLASKETASDDLIEERRKYENKTDREILVSFCPYYGATLCKKAIDYNLQTRPGDLAEIANSIRNKPPRISGKKLVYHKILETIIRKTEQKGYDEKLNKLVDFAVDKNPYLNPASKGIDLAFKFANKLK